MKFQLDDTGGGNLITRAQFSPEKAEIWVNQEAFHASVLVPWTGQPQHWPVRRFEELDITHFAQILALKPELVIFGSGTRLRFVHPSLLQALIEQGIGVETMDLSAACRTYTVLASERRSVVAALLIEPF